MSFGDPPGRLSRPGVCGCTIGPPYYGVCACGAAGPGYVDPFRSDTPPSPYEAGRYYFAPKIPTEDDIRRIIREELERLRAADGD